MRIEFSREGGLAFFPGLSKPQAVDLGALPPERAEALERAVGAARFFELPPTVGTASGADRTSYTLTIQEGERRHTVRFIEPVEEPHLRALLELVKQLEKERRREARAHKPPGA